MNTISKYYYHQLDSEQRVAYNLIYEGLSKFSNKIILPLAPKNNLKKIYQSVLWDNPVLFFTISFQYVTDVRKRIIVLTPTYRYSRDVVRQWSDILISYLHSFDYMKSKSDLQKELFVHDYCLNKLKYDYFFKKQSFSPLGPMIFDTGVCEGIAKFVKILFDYLGVGCVLVSGKAINGTTQIAEPHMWNIVEIDDGCYHLDVTYDMTLSKNIPRYDYFNLNDIEIKKDRTIHSNAPRCLIPNQDYYTVNSMTVYSLKEMEHHIRTNLLKGKKHMVIKLSNRNLFTSINLTGKIIDFATRQYRKIFSQSVSIVVNYNPSQQVFELIFT